MRLRPYLRRERRQQRLLVAILLAAGCSSARSPQQASGPQIERPAGRGSEPSAPKQAEPPAAVSGDQLAVRVAADPTSVCPGECSRLTAAAGGGVGAYTYRWNRGLPDGPGPHTVCPTQTSDYVVTVTDSSDTGAEFAVVNPPVSAAVELRVAAGPDCDAGARADAGAGDDGLDDAGEDAAPDAGTRTEPTAIGTTERLCTVPLSLPPDIELLNPSGQQLVADAQGDLIAIVAYSHALRTSDGRVVKDVATQASVLAKFAPDCKLRWSKQIGTTNNTLLLIAAATDRDGNIVTVGRISGRVQLESGSATAGPESGLIVKWDASGKALWHRVIAGSYQNYLFDVAVDDQGDVIVAGLADDGADLGAGSQGDPIDQSLYLAKYAATDGAHRWSRRLPFAVAQARISVLPSQHIVQVVTYDDGASRELQEFDADGALVRSMQSAFQPAIDLVDFATDTTPSLRILEPQGFPILTAERQQRIEALTTQFQPLWSVELASDFIGVTAQDIALDHAGNTLLASSFTGHLRIADRSWTSRPNAWDFYVLKLDARGRPQWLSTFDGAALAWPLGASAGLDDAMFMLAATSSGPTDTAPRASLSKFAP